jgi:hypothetical protein
VIEFRCRAGATNGLGTVGALGYVDVIADLGRAALARSDLPGVDRSGETRIRVEFETSTVFHDVEFRCFSFGREPFSVNEATILYDR